MKNLNGKNLIELAAKKESEIEKNVKKEENSENKDLSENLQKYLNKAYLRHSYKIFNISDEANYKSVANTLKAVLNANEPNGKQWRFEQNQKEMRLLLAWFMHDKHFFEKNKLDETQNINKDLFVCGVKGSGKSSTINALCEIMTDVFYKRHNAKQRFFKKVEQNMMATAYEIEHNINKYTFNQEEKKFEGNPLNIFLDDLKFNGLTKSFGTNFKDILIRFLYDRYSIWLFGQANTIITSLLTPKQLNEILPDDLYNRFKHQYNIIHFKGENRNV